MRTYLFSTVLLLSTSIHVTSLAADLFAGPGDYESVVPTLVAGDVLHLEAGTYTDLLSITDLHGTADQWIVITGPESGDPAVFVADPGPCCNTVEIRRSSHVAIRHLTIDGDGRDGAFGVSASGGTDNEVHHIAVESCTFVGHDAGQQIVAISTKTPTSGWIIRGNVIDGAGTGLYLGNSDGTSPFVGGLIEYNLFTDTMGYSMEIKWQQPRPDHAALPDGPSTTIIRHNVFLKNDRDSPLGDRPNVLVGGFPDTGAGSEDRYEIHGNLFFHNARESLLQASGRVSIHDNVFVDVTGTAIRLQDHDLPMRQAWVYNNTIHAAGTGIRAGGTLDQGCIVVGNLVFADEPITGSPTDQRDNLLLAVADAASYVTHPGTTLGDMDFYPLPGTCEGSPLDLSAFAADTDGDLDFNSTHKGGFTFRGAYAGEGTNPGWALDGTIKDTPAEPPPDESPDSPPDTSPDAPPDVAPDATTDPAADTHEDADLDTEEDTAGQGDGKGDGGCGCGVTGEGATAPEWLAFLGCLALGIAAHRRSMRTKEKRRQGNGAWMQ